MAQSTTFFPIVEVPPVTMDALEDYYHAHAYAYIQHPDIEPHALYKLMMYAASNDPLIDVITHANTPGYALSEGIQYIREAVTSLTSDLSHIAVRPLTEPADAAKAKLLSGILARAMQDYEAACELTTTPQVETDDHKRYRRDEDKRWVAAMSVEEPWRAMSYADWVLEQVDAISPVD